MNTFCEHRSCSPLLTTKKFTGATAGCPQLSSLVGINVPPQVGSIFNEGVRDNTAKHWNGVAPRRTTQSDANNHRRYLATRKSLDAA